MSWGLIFILIDIAFEGIHPRHILDLLLPTTSGTCWYFSAYMYMLMLSPILNKGIGYVSKKQYQLFLIFILVVEFAGGTLYHYNGTTLTQLLFIYLIGQYLRKYPIKIIESKPEYMLIVSCGINNITVFLSNYFQIGGYHISKLVESNKNPLVLVSAISLFMIAKKHRQTKVMNIIGKLAPYMFSVYISHVILLYLKIVDFKEIIVISPIISVIVMSIAILFIGVFVDKLRILIFGKTLDKIETLIETKLLRE